MDALKKSLTNVNIPRRGIGTGVKLLVAGAIGVGIISQSFYTSTCDKN